MKNLPPLILTPLTHMPLIRQGDDLADIIIKSLNAGQLDIQENDILVVTQKIVSKAEGRLVKLGGIQPGAAAMDLAQRSEKDPRIAELILRESREVLRTRPGLVIVEHRLGFVCANAGIDRSNVAGDIVGENPNPGSSSRTSDNPEEWVMLLPVDPDRSASYIRARIESLTHRKIGVMIIDSHGRAWRLGTVGMCIGLSGIPAIIDERGWQDLFGYTLQVTVVGVADELAAAASLVMGQAAEGAPVVHVRGFPYQLEEGSLKALIRPKEQDLFR